MLIKKTKIPFRSIVTIGLLPSFLKKIIYRIKGFKIGNGVTIGLGSVIIGKNVSIGNGVKIGIATVIRANTIKIERFAVVGSFSIIDTGELRIGEDARINEQVIVGGMKTPESKLDLGCRTIIMEYSFINTTKPIIIGDDSGVGGHCLLFTHGSWLNQLEGYPVTFAPITIGKNVWLPWRVFIMPGVNIGDGVVVGANSLISKSVESYSFIAGSPAKVIRENYPPQIPQEKLSELFNTMIQDFINHLTFHGANVDVALHNDKQIVYVGKYSHKHFNIIIAIGESINEYEFLRNDLVFISNNKDLNPHHFKTSRGKTLTLDIQHKTRSGNSDIGEEFVKFVSRYGLRFSRLD